MNSRRDSTRFRSRWRNTRTLTTALIVTLIALVVTLGALVVALGALIAALMVSGPSGSPLPLESSDSPAHSQQMVPDEEGPVIEAEDSDIEWEPAEVQEQETIQELIDRADAGETIRVPAGIYRESVIIDKPITLVADSGAEIRGSDVWTEWNRSGNQWVSSNPAPEFDNNHGYCDSQIDESCMWQEQVFLDGTPLERVRANPASGQFAVGSEREIVLGDDPDGRLVEVSVREFWVTGDSEDVTVEGFTMKHAANRAQTGAINNNGFDNWTIRDNDLSHAHGANVSLNGASNLILDGNDISYGGQLGVHGSHSSDIQVTSNRIYENNTAGYSTGWEAGGLKMAIVTRAVFDGNESFNNHGPGLWCDIDCDEVIISNNIVYQNHSSGITYEISRNARIHGNVVWENASDHRQWGWGAGIRIQNSRDCEVYDNIVAWNGDGISVISQDRGESAWNEVANNTIRDNQVFSVAVQPHHDFALAWLEDWDGVLTESSSNNEGASNAYYHWNPDDVDVVFTWGEEEFSFADLDQFGRTPGEDDARILSSDEKDQLLTDAGVPTSPDRR